VSGELPCSKEEAAILAGIQLRIEETWPESKHKDLTTTATTLQQTSLRQNINSSGEKLRPICEDVKVCQLYLNFYSYITSSEHFSINLIISLSSINKYKIKSDLNH
jgi:hypothetical protein